MSEQSLKIGPAGGTVQVEDGFAVTLAGGALQAAQDVTLRRIDRARYLGAPDRAVYEIAGIRGPFEAAISFKPAPGAALDHYDAACYGATLFDRRVGKVAIRGSADGFAAEAVRRLDLTVDPRTGRISTRVHGGQSPATAGAAAKPSAPPASATRVVVACAPPHVARSAEKRIRMPYYEQVAGSCWASDAAMMIKGVKRAGGVFSDTKVPNILRWGGFSNADYGIREWYFSRGLPFALELDTHIAFSGGTYWLGGSLRSRILKCLDQDRPVLMSYGAHALLILGYRRTAAPDKLEILLHDSKNITPANAIEGGMYTWRDWAWVESRDPLAIALVYPEADIPAESGRVLQTISYPSQGDAGWIRFMGRPAPGKPEMTVAEYAWNIEGSERHQWLGTGKRASAASGNDPVAGPADRVSPIPTTAEWLAMRLPLWNASNLPTAVKVRVTLRVESDESQSEPDRTITIPAESCADCSYRIDANLLRPLEKADSRGVCQTRVKVELLSSAGAYLDGFYFDARMATSPPVITACTATSGGRIAISLQGSCFGGTRRDSKVLVNGKPLANYTSWSNTRIEGLAPEGAETGEAKVSVVVRGIESTPFRLELAGGLLADLHACNAITVRMECAGVEMQKTYQGRNKKRRPQETDSDAAVSLEAENVYTEAGVAPRVFPITWNGTSFSTSYDLPKSGGHARLSIEGNVSPDARELIEMKVTRDDASTGSNIDSGLQATFQVKNVPFHETNANRAWTPPERREVVYSLEPQDNGAFSKVEWQRNQRLVDSRTSSRVVTVMPRTKSEGARSKIHVRFSVLKP